jgi:anti-sigma B factor antagonist
MIPSASSQVVVFPVEADVSCSEAVGETLLAAFGPGVSVVIADMSATEYCDSSAIRQLIIAYKQAASTGAELRVVTASPAVRRVLNVLEVDQLLNLYPDMASALARASSESV